MLDITGEISLHSSYDDQTVQRKWFRSVIFILSVSGPIYMKKVFPPLPMHIVLIYLSQKE